MAKTNAAGRAVGRPRLFEDETERRMLIDGALQVMTHKGFTEMSVDDVLGESGLSTRAFYRHFDSKAALLDALMLKEAASVGRALTRVVAQAPDPVAAVEAWLERYLDVFYQPRRAERAALLTSEAGRASRMSDAMRREMRRIACSPLIEALRAGDEAGLLASPTPEVDAYSIHDLVGAYYTASDSEVPDRSAVRAHVVRFAWPALALSGASPPAQADHRVEGYIPDPTGYEAGAISYVATADDRREPGGMALFNGHRRSGPLRKGRR